ncbi:hypothetical protein ACLOJK_008091 [Asimina triloba]
MVVLGTVADALVSIALEKLAQVLLQQVSQVTLFVGTTRELRRLPSTFQSIQALLHESMSIWLSKLKKVAYDIDGVLDEWQTISKGLTDQQGNEDEGCNGIRHSCGTIFKGTLPSRCIHL